MSDTKQLAIPDQTTAVAPANAGPLDAILSNPKALEDLPVDTLERLYALHERDQARTAEREFNEAMRLVQEEVDPIAKRARNEHTRSMYARLEDVNAALSPVALSHGFSMSTSTAESQTPDMIRVMLKIRHVGGHSEVHEMTAAIDVLGPKGGTVKTKLQGAGSTFSYCTRMLKCNVFNLHVVEDNDGNQPVNTEPISENEARDLQSALEEVDANLTKFNQYFGIEHIGQLPQQRLGEAQRFIERKRVRS